MTSRAPSAPRFRPEESFARQLDDDDPLASYRERFRFPTRQDGRPVRYFCGNSLGLQPSATPVAVERELDAWARFAVDAHFAGDAPWYDYHALLREPSARLVGAHPDEVVVMNSLTVNLHLMLVSFYRPTSGRDKILMEDCAFPSDTYAVKSQLVFHGRDPADALIVARGSDGRPTVPTDELEHVLDRHGEQIALVLLGGVNYYTGQLFDLKRITEAARRQGCIVGIDLAHAAGNVPLELHEWDVDFAVWCSYKYLNGGPGAVAGCFVHRRHARSTELPRFGGWWGNDPDGRFRMHLEPEFKPVPTADGWQLSNPSILAMAPLRVSLGMFDEVGMEALRTKSRALTAYLASWVEHATAGRVKTLTPRDPAARGCQLSLRVLDDGDDLFRTLKNEGVVADFREPDVVRLAPVPLYNSFHDVWSLGQALGRWSAKGR